MAPGLQLHTASTQQIVCASHPGARGPSSPATCCEAAPIARILVSEDNPGIQRLYSRLLPRHGFELICVPSGDGRQTIEFARRFAPQLVITDVNKPTLDGHALVAALRDDQRTARIPALMVTAMDQRGEWRQAGRAPADDYIVKPFLFEDLLYRISTLLAWPDEARDELSRRAAGLPCYDYYHPATGLPCLHSLAAALPAHTARRGWAAAEIAFANHRALIEAYGRPLVDGFAGQLGSAIRKAAGAELLVGHSGFDLRVAIVGPAGQVSLALSRLAARLDSLTRPRTILGDAPAPRLAMRHADDSAGYGLGLPALLAALQ